MDDGSIYVIQKIRIVRENDRKEILETQRRLLQTMLLQQYSRN